MHEDAFRQIRESGLLQGLNRRTRTLSQKQRAVDRDELSNSILESHINQGHSMNPSYIIVTPVRDEEKYIESTIESVLRQTIRPAEWLIAYMRRSTHGSASYTARTEASGNPVAG
jgi:hypothetical protein